jgi:hypothetical protein
MANNENKATKPAETAKEERVELFIPRGTSSEDPNEVIGLNGVLYVLPKGKKSLVPAAVAEEYYRAQRAKEIFDDGVSKRLEQAAQML